MSEQLRERFKDYEVTPPPGAWNNIARELEENNELIRISQKMYNYEEQPPVSAWKLIQESLLSKEEITLPTHRKIFNIRAGKVITAAAILGVVFMGSLYIIYNSSAKRLPSGQQKDLVKGQQKSKASDPAPASAIPDLVRAEEKQSASIASIASEFIARKEKKNYSRGNEKSLRNAIVRIAHAFTPTSNISVAARPIRNEKGDIIQDTRLVNNGGQNYINVTGPNGQQTRISSKFMNFLMYLNNDNDIEEFEGYFDKNFLESLIWKSKFDNWRNKILQGSLSPSSTNFMDILEFKDLLLKDKDNQ